MEKRGWLDAVLGLGPDWRITRVERTPERKELRVELARAGGGQAAMSSLRRGLPGLQHAAAGVAESGRMGLFDLPGLRCAAGAVVGTRGGDTSGATRAGPGRSPDGTGGSTGRRAAAWIRSSKPPAWSANTSGASSTLRSRVRPTDPPKASTAGSRRSRCAAAASATRNASRTPSTSISEASISTPMAYAHDPPPTGNGEEPKRDVNYT